MDKKCKQKNYFVSGIDLPTFRFDANVMTAEPKTLKLIIGKIHFHDLFNNEFIIEKIHFSDLFDNELIIGIIHFHDLFNNELIIGNIHFPDLFDNEFIIGKTTNP